MNTKLILYEAKKAVGDHMPSLMLGLLAGTVSSLIGEYAFKMGDIAACGIGMGGFLAGCAAGIFLQRGKTNFRIISFGSRIAIILLGGLGMLVGIVGAISCIKSHDWVALVCSIALTAGGYGMLRRMLLRRD